MVVVAGVEGLLPGSPLSDAGGSDTSRVRLIRLRSNGYRDIRDRTVNIGDLSDNEYESILSELRDSNSYERWASEAEELYGSSEVDDPHSFFNELLVQNELDDWDRDPNGNFWTLLDYLDEVDSNDFDEYGNYIGGSK